MSIEAMKQSMETLTRFLNLFYQCAPLDLVGKADECIDQLRRAIEQAEKQKTICPRCGATLVTPYADLCGND